MRAGGGAGGVAPPRARPRRHGHRVSRVNENKYPCRICLKVVGVGREGLFCSACYVCHGCGLSNTCEPQEARANIDCVNAFLKRQSSGSSHLGDRLKRPL